MTRLERHMRAYAAGTQASATYHTSEDADPTTRDAQISRGRTLFDYMAAHHKTASQSTKAAAEQAFLDGWHDYADQLKAERG